MYRLTAIIATSIKWIAVSVPIVIIAIETNVTESIYDDYLKIATGTNAVLFMYCL